MTPNDDLSSPTSTEPQLQSSVNVECNRDHIDQMLSERIAEEVATAKELVNQFEADAVSRGVPLKLSGARYKIYQTITP